MLPEAKANISSVALHLSSISFVLSYSCESPRLHGAIHLEYGINLFEDTFFLIISRNKVLEKIKHSTVPS